MVLITKFGIGDIVACGPIEDAMITGITYASVITYNLTYWSEKTPLSYTAWEWELELVTSAAPSGR